MRGMGLLMQVLVKGSIGAQDIDVLTKCRVRNLNGKSFEVMM